MSIKRREIEKFGQVQFQNGIHVNGMYIISMNVRNKYTCLNLRKVEAWMNEYRLFTHDHAVLKK